MDGQGESSQNPDRTTQRARQDSCLGDVILLGTFTSVAWLTIQPFVSLLSLHAAPQSQLAYGGATSAVAIVAALLSGLAGKLREGYFRLIVGTVAFAFLVFPRWWAASVSHWL